MTGLTERGRVQAVEEVVEALWIACRSRLPRNVSLVGVDPGAAGRVAVRLDRPTGQFARRRLVGCLEDATIDRVQATVVAVRP